MLIGSPFCAPLSENDRAVVHAARGVGVAEDNGGPPLPRRAPGTKRGPGTGPLARPVLSDSDLQRIRAALDSAHAQAPAPPAERPARLPRRVRDTSKASQAPAHTARPESPAALLPTRPKKAPTEPAPAVPPPRPGEVAEETRGQPDATAQPGPAAGAPAGPQLVPAQRAPAEEREERQDHPDEDKASPEQETASQEKVPAVPKDGQAGLEKAQLHGTRALPRRPKPAAQETPPSRPQPAPPKPAPPTAPASPPSPARTRKRGRGRAIITGSAIATLVLLSAGSALLLTRHAGTAKASPERQRGGSGPRPRRGLGGRTGRPGWPDFVRSTDVPGAPGTRRSRC